jgi:integrase
MFGERSHLPSRAAKSGAQKHCRGCWKGGDERQFATTCDRARRVIARLGVIAGVEDAHPHRFRDTWAKTALLNGTPMRTVQLTLGHKSIRTTEEHYAHYVPEYQEMIDAATDAVPERLIA